MLKDSIPPRQANRRTHRSYTPQFKAQLVAACQRPGASIAALANANAMNANVVHRWLQEHARSGAHQLSHSPTQSQPLQTVVPEPPAFIALPMTLQHAGAAHELKPPPAPPATIRVEIQQPKFTIVVNWPLHDSAACAQWLRECLQ